MGSPNRRPPGRPRICNDHDALEAAMRCFWQHGYDGSSIGRLTERMALPRASLYLRFASKKGLFLASLDHYARTRSGRVTARLSARGDAAGEIGAFFNDMIALVSADPEARGCLIACVLTDAAGNDPQFRSVLRHRLEGLETRLRACLEADTSQPTDGKAAQRAALLAATARGLAVAARADTPPDTLRATARLAVELACQPRPCA